MQKFCFEGDKQLNPLFAICLLFPGSSAISGENFFMD